VNSIATESDHSTLATHPRLAMEEKAILTYEAMAGSDDIVLVLERQDGATTDDAPNHRDRRRISPRFGIFR
jgi:hypothetical protein